MPEPGGDDDCGRRSPFAGSGDDAGHGGRGRNDHQQIGGGWQFVDGPDRPYSFDLAIVRVDEMDCSLEPRFSKISQYRTAGRIFTGASSASATDRGEKSLSRR